MSKAPITLGGLVVLAACSTPSKEVRIDTEPPAAELYLQGELLGTAPFVRNFSFSGSEGHEIVARQAGHEDGKIAIRYEPSQQKAYLIRLQKKEDQVVPKAEVVTVQNREGVQVEVRTLPTIAYTEVIERSPNVRSVTLLTDNEDPAVTIGKPTLSGNGRTLVYEIIEEMSIEGEVTTVSNLWQQAVGSKARTCVTNGVYKNFDPTFSSDGSYIYFASNRNSRNPTLWRVSSRGQGGIAKITSSRSGDAQSSVSPDGQLLAYSSAVPGAATSQIWTIDTDGRLPTQLREGTQPRISPDGTEILFVRSDSMSKRQQIWKMSIDGSNETQLTSSTMHDCTDPSWSPNGKWLAFVSNEGLDSKQRQNSDIWVMAPDGSLVRQLTTNGSQDDGPAWSADGQFIYFRSNRGGHWNLWRFEPLLPQPND